MSSKLKVHRSELCMPSGRNTSAPAHTPIQTEPLHYTHARSEPSQQFAIPESQYLLHVRILISCTYVRYRISCETSQSTTAMKNEGENTN